MTESSLTQDLLMYLKSRARWTVLKHCDRFTKGIPDLSVSNGIRTFWIEVKILKSGYLGHPAQFVDNKVQLKLTSDLDGWYYVYHTRDQVASFVPADEVLEASQLGIELDDKWFGPGKRFEEIYLHVRKELYGKDV